MLLEICANSYESAINAQKAGAQRIELCSELFVGGITPSYGLLKQVSEAITIPVHVLIRPRSGDFCYADSEFEQMKTDILVCKKMGFQGIVSGILNLDNTINMERTKELISISKPLSFTFHRAFDVVQNPKKALDELIYLEVDRILTSGLQDKAENGMELLVELQKMAKEKIIILPGSGINIYNVQNFKKAGFKEIHTSASKKMVSKKNIFFDETIQTVSDLNTIQEIIKIIK